VKTYDKSGSDSSASHHRLLGILHTFYADWDTSVEYVCNEYMHNLEDTYWKSRVCIYIKDEEKDAYQLDSTYFHWARRATMDDSIENVAYEACMGLHGRRFEDMKEDQY